MYVNPVSDLRLMAVLHRGIANKECVALRAEETVNMGRFGLMLGVTAGDELATPIRDNLFWFGDGVVQKGDWIFIYTCAGTPTKSTSVDGTNTYAVHWGRKTTLFANSLIVPMLFEVGAVQIGVPPKDVPQLSLPSR